MLNSDCGAWKLGVKVTNYQDKDEMLERVDEQGKVYS